MSEGNDFEWSVLTYVRKERNFVTLALERRATETLFDSRASNSFLVK